jgi:hypothetical protein
MARNSDHARRLEGAQLLPSRPIQQNYKEKSYVSEYIFTGAMIQVPITLVTILRNRLCWASRWLHNADNTDVGAGRERDRSGGDC